MVFHQASRYYLVKKVINSFKYKKNNTVLEVGSSSHFNLLDVFPNDEITFLDINMPEELVDRVHYIKGDATKLEYESDRFDFSIALDVIEHVPFEKRGDMIREMLRVSKQGIFLSFPIDNKQSKYDTKMLEVYYRMQGMNPPDWLYEHMDCTLPTVENIEEILKAEGISESSYVCFFGSNLDLMNAMLYLETMASNDRLYEVYFKILNEYYIENVMQYDYDDNADNQAKAYIYISKQEQITKPLRIIGDGNKEVIARFIDRIKIEEERIKGKSLKKNQRQLSLVKNTDIVVDVILISYNHSRYITEALKSVISQKTNFKYRVIVADDASKDDTVDIIRGISSTTQIEFKFLENTHNLGIMNNYRRAFASCDAKYVAILEGDDFWTDEFRLQKMVDFMDVHEECSMVFNRYNVTCFEKNMTHVQPRVSEQLVEQGYVIFSGHDLAYDNLIGNFSTCLYRGICIQNLPEDLYEIPCYDWLTNIVMSRMGSVGCLTDVMSTYRIHDKGVWSAMDPQKQRKDLIKIIDVYDEYTNYEFHDGFQAHKKRLQGGVHQSVKQKLVKIIEFIPPVCIYVIKAIVPPVVWKRIVE